MQFMLILCIGLLATPAFSADDKPQPDAKAKLRKKVKITNNYVHSWTPFPKLVGKDVLVGAEKKIKPRYGEVLAVFWLGTWNNSSKFMLPQIQKLQAKYEKLFSRFIYVFTRDLEQDVVGAAKAYQLKGTVILPSEKSTVDYKMPNALPQVFIADRFGWLNYWEKRLDSEKIRELDKYLAKLNVI